MPDGHAGPTVAAGEPVHCCALGAGLASLQRLQPCLHLASLKFRLQTVARDFDN